LKCKVFQLFYPNRLFREWRKFNYKITKILNAIHSNFLELLKYFIQGKDFENICLHASLIILFISLGSYAWFEFSYWYFHCYTLRAYWMIHFILYLLLCFLQQYIEHKNSKNWCVLLESSWKMWFKFLQSDVLN